MISGVLCRQPLVDFEGASFDPVVRKLFVPDFHDRDRDEIDWDLIWRRTEQSLVEAGDTHSGADMPSVFWHKDRFGYRLEVADLGLKGLQPGPEGLRVEVYVFSKDQAWAKYEDNQADIFDHILAVIPEFGLRVFQNPSGADFRKIVR